jgi:iron complex outermembrane receptor protein
MGLRVTSVSRREERLLDAAGAVFVLTREDLRRSGARNVPEALRGVPGLHMAQINASQWAVSIRGFTDRFANKLLVLVDGRSVASHLFSGVFFEGLDIPLSEIDRIEIVRGPGGALWGTNAVNGVINIVTRSGRSEPGGSVEAGLETGERSVTAAGEGAWGRHAAYRIWGAGTEVDKLSQPGGASAHDGRTSMRGGARVDGDLGNGDYTFEAGLYRMEADRLNNLPQLDPPYVQAVDDPLFLSGGYTSARWSRRRPSSRSTDTLQVYADVFHREVLFSDIGVRTFSLDFQSDRPLGESHNLVWGSEIRLLSDEIRTFPTHFTIHPARRTSTLWSFFVQDQAALAQERVHLSLGSKLEYSELVGKWNVLPSVRARWNLPHNQVVWASASRSARSPGRSEVDLEKFWLATVPSGSGLPIQIVATRGKDAGSEEMIAWELGYRARPNAQVSFDVTAFHNDYEHVLTTCADRLEASATPVPHLTQYLRSCEGGTAEARGFETVLTWTPSRRWTWSLTASRLDFSASLQGDPSQWDGTSPRNMAQLRLQGDPAPRWKTDLSAYYSDSLPGQGVPSFLRADLRLERELRPGLSLELIGRNLLDEGHREFGAPLTGGVAAEVRRSTGVSLRWRF